jgi:hypothetical protein
LANSLGKEVHRADADCRQDGGGRWRCALSGSPVNGVEYELTTHRFGCWSGSRVFLPRTATPVKRSVSGCIGLTDLVGS